MAGSFHPHPPGRLDTTTHPRSTACADHILTRSRWHTNWRSRARTSTPARISLRTTIWWSSGAVSADSPPPTSIASGSANDSRILILENHDEFGGHATRNEFHQGGADAAWSGAATSISNTRHSASRATPCLRSWASISTASWSTTDFNYGDDGRLGPAIYFDAETYGRDVLIPGFTPRWGDFTRILGKARCRAASVRSHATP